MIIRKATVKDSEFIATYLLSAMEDIVCMLIGTRDAKEAKQFMLHFAEKENNQYSYQNCWVVEEQHEVLGAVNLYDGAQLRELRKPVLEHLRSRYNRELQPEDETEPGEYYIDSLGVNQAHRGKGIGSAMLRFLIDEYANKHSQPLGLLVDEENPTAKRLYLKLGFKSSGRKLLFGKNMEHLQIKVGPAREVPNNTARVM